MNESQPQHTNDGRRRAASFQPVVNVDDDDDQGSIRTTSSSSHSMTAATAAATPSSMLSSPSPSIPSSSTPQEQPPKSQRSSSMTNPKKENSFRRRFQPNNNDKSSTNNNDTESVTSEKPSMNKRVTNAVKNSPFNLLRVRHKLKHHTHPKKGGNAAKKNSSKNNQENGNATTTERTPLLPTTPSPPIGSSLQDGALPLFSPTMELMEEGRSGGITSSYTSPIKKLSKGWRAVLDHHKKGDFLLMAKNVSSSNPNSNNDDGNDDPNTPNKMNHEEMVQEAIDEIRSGIEFSLWHCIAAIFIYLAISVLCYHFFFLEKHTVVDGTTGDERVWTIVDTIYFAVTTFTTVGYGDLTPHTTASRMFTCCYALMGVAVLGIALGILGSNLVDAQDKAIAKAEQVSKDEMLNMFGLSDDQPTVDLDVINEVEEEIGGDGVAIEYGYDDQGKLTNLRNATSGATKGKDDGGDTGTGCIRAMVLQSAPLLVILLLLASWIGDVSGWDWSETIYYFVITACTVGYGDLAPTTQSGKMIAIVFIPLAVASMGHWLSLVASWIMEGRSARHRKKLARRELTQRDLDIMDEDGDGQVTRAEFLEFMLVAMNRVDKELIDELRDHFDRLDVDGTGTLSREDLVENARRKLYTVRNKLHLAAYRERLLQQASGDVHESFWGNLMGRSGFVHGLSFRKQ